MHSVLLVSEQDRGGELPRWPARKPPALPRGTLWRPFMAAVAVPAPRWPVSVRLASRGEV